MKLWHIAYDGEHVGHILSDSHDDAFSLAASDVLEIDIFYIQEGIPELVVTECVGAVATVL